MELAKKVTAYFEWNINEHLNQELKEHWPKIPSDLGNPREFIQADKDSIYREPVAIESHQVPRFTLTSYQPNWTLSHYCFCEDNEDTFHFELYEDSWEAHQIQEGIDDKEDQKYISPEMQEFLAELKTKEAHPYVKQHPAPMIIYDSDDDEELFSDDSSKPAMTT